MIVAEVLLSLCCLEVSQEDSNEQIEDYEVSQKEEAHHENGSDSSVDSHAFVHDGHPAISGKNLPFKKKVVNIPGIEREQIGLYLKHG